MRVLIVRTLCDYIYPLLIKSTCTFWETLVFFQRNHYTLRANQRADDVKGFTWVIANWPTFEKWRGCLIAATSIVKSFTGIHSLCSRGGLFDFSLWCLWMWLLLNCGSVLKWLVMLMFITVKILLGCKYRALNVSA